MDDSFIYGTLEGISSCKNGKIRVVQIGANDGTTNDPIFKWASNNYSLCHLVLIEPQADVFERLLKNYANHPSAVFHNTAIGPKGRLRLYRIRSEFDHLYRGIIASGITSHDRNYVLNKVRRNLDWKAVGSPEDAIEEFDVECHSLVDLIGEKPNSVDFLQVDTEGFDDFVLYNCSIDVFRPKIINYEFIHLDSQRLAILHRYLVDQGYKLVRWSSEDECAIRTYNSAD